MNAHGRFIVFEGLDGAGTTTQGLMAPVEPARLCSARVWMRSRSKPRASEPLRPPGLSRGPYISDSPAPDSKDRWFIAILEYS